LHALGYRHATTLVPPPNRNGVLIAARCPFREHGAVDMGLPEPYRMVSVDFAAFRLSGVYMPNLLAKVPYWEALIAALSSQSATHALAIGDFNTCPRISRRGGGDRRDSPLHGCDRADWVSRPVAPPLSGWPRIFLVQHQG
jgi:exonuclease III